MRNLIATLFILAMTSCASMFNPGPDLVQVTSTPPGASVALDTQPTGLLTPCTITVPRKSKGQVTVQLDGFTSLTKEIKTDLNGPVVLNVLLGWVGVFGIIADIAGGNATVWTTVGPFILTKE